MTKQQRQNIYLKYDGHCAYCGKFIALKDMQADHIIPKRQGGKDAVENYNPSCRRCNHYKRALDLESFRKYIATLHERIVKNYIVKVGIDFGIIEIRPFNGKFYFENINNH